MTNDLVPRRPGPAAGGRLGAHAVVLGASLSGLLAARVLADSYGHVTVVDRDRLSSDGGVRRGVPQARHAHVLLPRGAAVLDELFPGFLAELREAGVPVVRRLDELHCDLGGHLLSQQRLASDPQYGVSRPFLEARVLRRVKALPNVTVLDDHEVLGLDTDESGTRVTGARIACHAATGGQTALAAEVVVAATGRSNRVASWLGELGYPAPREQQVKVDVMYATRLMRLRPGVAGELLGVLVGPTPDRPVGIGAFAQEDDHWVVTLGGFGGHHPPAEYDAWLECAARLVPGRFASALREARVLEEVQTHRFTENLRRRYDKLTVFPGGLIVVGDAMCSFNPIYGQGMTVAALEALALRTTLLAGDLDLGRRFFRAAAKPIGAAWRLAVGADLMMPPDVVPGARSLPLRAVNAYLGGYQAVAEHDPELARRFLRVTGLSQPTRKLFTPASVGRVALGSLSRRERADRTPMLHGVTGRG